MVEIIVTENGNVRGVFSRVISASLTDSLNGECTFQFSVISSMASEIFTGLEVQLKSDTLNYLFNVVKVVLRFAPWSANTSPTNLTTMSTS